MEVHLKRLPQPHLLGLIAIERRRQDGKWGVQRHEDGKWLAILVEEVGEVARSLIEKDPKDHLLKGLVQVAAVAVAWGEALVEQIDEAPFSIKEG